MENQQSAAIEAENGGKQMKAVMYGAGNIGRGFIGALFAQSGYQVSFVDVVEATVQALNRDRQYPVRIVWGDGYEEQMIQGVSAVDGRDPQAVAQAIDQADIMATAVGVNVMKYIAPVIAQGLKLRCAAGRGPLNIIICENLLDANKVMEGMLKEHLTPQEQQWFDQNVGLVEASIGRMVPVQTPQMQSGNPLRVCVERYGFLPVDKDAFRGEIPNIQRLVPYSPFDYYIRRKLYVHNMGHATCAYLGMLEGHEYIYESIQEAEVRLICQSAMTESALALSKCYGVEAGGIMDHVFDLLTRFENRALGDTCARVGGDTTRKLKATDRLIGPARLCLEHDVIPAFICLGAAAAVRAHLEGSGQAQTRQNAQRVLQEVSGLTEQEPLMGMILGLYEKVAAGATVGELRRAADRLQVETRGPIA